MKKIKVKNAEEYKKALEIFALTGYQIGYHGISIEKFVTKFPFNGSIFNGIQNFVGISECFSRNETTYITAWNDNHTCDSINFSDKKALANLIVEILSLSNQKIVEKVGEYKAVISPNGIKVGCTTISFEKFDEIAAAVKEVRG
jgi:hypothetical protein